MSVVFVPSTVDTHDPEIYKFVGRNDLLPVHERPEPIETTHIDMRK